MKIQILQAITNLENFLTESQTILSHPYSAGLNVEKMLGDLQDFAKDLKTMVESLEEASEPVAEMSEENIENETGE